MFFFIKHKSEVTERFVEFKAMIENQTSRKIKILLRTDNGKECVNNELKSVLEKNGIRHQTTVAYIPQQNELAKRTNRTIVERARIMLLDAGLSKRFWAEATLTAVYLINRSPSKKLHEKTPEEIWRKRKPDLRHLNVFGCVAMVLIPKVKRDKWERC